STNTKGDWPAVPNVPIPRIRIVPASPPGLPELCVTVTPGATPCSAMEVCPTGFQLISSLLITDTDPVKLTSFVVPYPTTTTSSSVASRFSNATFITAFPETSTDVTL